MWVRTEQPNHSYFQQNYHKILVFGQYFKQRNLNRTRAFLAVAWRNLGSFIRRNLISFWALKMCACHIKKKAENSHVWRHKNKRRSETATACIARITSGDRSLPGGHVYMHTGADWRAARYQQQQPIYLPVDRCKQIAGEQRSAEALWDTQLLSARRPPYQRGVNALSRSRPRGAARWLLLAEHEYSM